MAALPAPEALFNLLREHGLGVLDAPLQVRQALLPETQSQRAWLWAVYSAEIPQKLLQDAAPTVILEAATVELCQLGLTVRQAEWALSTWLNVLGAFLENQADVSTPGYEELVLTAAPSASVPQRGLLAGFKWLQGTIRKRGVVYGGLLAYTVCFVAFFSGLMGFLTGLIFGATLSYVLELNMFYWYLAGGSLLGTVASVAGLRIFLHDLQVRQFRHEWRSFWR